MSQAKPRTSQIGNYYALSASLKMLYEASAQRLEGRRGVGFVGINTYTSNSVASFILAAAAWESFLNFVFFSVWAKVYFGEPIYDRFHKLEDALDKLSVIEKTYAIPLIAFNKTFDRGASPFQDLEVIVTLRNHSVHNRMQRSPEKAIETLRVKKLLLPVIPNSQRPLSWIEEVSTLEAIRWSINVLAQLNQSLSAMNTLGTKVPIHQSFPEFTAEEATRFLKKINAL